MVNYNRYRPIIEALLFVSGDEGLTCEQIAKVLDEDIEEVRDWLEQIKWECENSEFGLTILKSGDSYSFVTKISYAPYIKKFIKNPERKSLSQASLETVAIIAYHQPITRLEIEKIRGVSVNTPLQKLLSRGIIQEVGRSEQVGRAVLYGTTDVFLNYFGIESLEMLPQLPEEMSNVSKEAELFK